MLFQTVARFLPSENIVAIVQKRYSIAWIVRGSKLFRRFAVCWGLRDVILIHDFERPIPSVRGIKLLRFQQKLTEQKITIYNTVNAV